MADDNMPGEHGNTSCAADDVTWGKCKLMRCMSGPRRGRQRMATAMRVFARFFVLESVAVQRDEHLLTRVIGIVRPAASPGQAILRWLHIVCSRHAQRGRPWLVVDYTSSSGRLRTKAHCN